MNLGNADPTIISQVRCLFHEFFMAQETRIASIFKNLRGVVRAEDCVLCFSRGFRDFEGDHF
jgi:hypothetical protein